MSFPKHRGAAARTERRSEARVPADQHAVIKLLNPVQDSTRIEAHVVEMSHGGLKLRLDEALMPGTLVQIRLGDQLLMGEIRFCSHEADGFHAGVRLQDVFDTSA